MLKQVTFAGVIALLSGAGTGLAAQDANTVVATVGTTEITLGEMIIIRAQLPQQYQGLADDVLFEGILDQLIQQQLLADAAGDAPPRVAFALSNERRTLMAGEAINVIAADAVNDDAIAAAFAEMTDGADPVIEWNASHLLVDTQEEAAAARERIIGGEAFADVARDVSTGPSGPTGGELGWFSAGQMVAEFEQAVESMDVGEVSEPVQTQFGWHIVTLVDKRNKPLPELEELRPQIEEQLQESAILGRIEELRAAATIVLPEEGAIDPAILNNLDLLEPK